MKNGGILKRFRRWRLQGSPFFNSDLRYQLQQEVQARSACTVWRHVYSHIGVVGNQHADSLANSGPLAKPQRRQYLTRHCRWGELLYGCTRHAAPSDTLGSALSRPSAF